MQVLDASFIASATHHAQLPPPTFAEIAFAGRSNVGKSSLINALLQRRKLVRTSSTPGCTRAIQLFRVKIPNAELDFVDLPGYGYAQRSKSERRSWGALVEDLLRERAGLRGVVVIVDVRRGLEEDDEQLLEFLESIGRTPIVVATKLDKLPVSQRKLALKALAKNGSHRMHGFSAITGEGRDTVWRTILRVAGIEGAS